MKDLTIFASLLSLLLFVENVSSAASISGEVNDFFLVAERFQCIACSQSKDNRVMEYLSCRKNIPAKMDAIRKQCMEKEFGHTDIKTLPKNACVDPSRIGRVFNCERIEQYMKPIKIDDNIIRSLKMYESCLRTIHEKYCPEDDYQ